jgi:hypothetical protein
VMNLCTTRTQHTQLLLPPKRAWTRAVERREGADLWWGSTALVLRLRAPRAPQRAEEAEEVMRRALIVDVNGEIWFG